MLHGSVFPTAKIRTSFYVIPGAKLFMDIKTRGFRWSGRVDSQQALDVLELNDGEAQPQGAAERNASF